MTSFFYSSVWYRTMNFVDTRRIFSSVSNFIGECHWSMVGNIGNLSTWVLIPKNRLSFTHLWSLHSTLIDLMDNISIIAQITSILAQELFFNFLVVFHLYSHPANTHSRTHFFTCLLNLASCMACEQKWREFIFMRVNVSHLRGIEVPRFRIQAVATILEP